MPGPAGRYPRCAARFFARASRALARAARRFSRVSGCVLRRLDDFIATRLREEADRDDGLALVFAWVLERAPRALGLRPRLGACDWRRSSCRWKPETVGRGGNLLETNQG